MNREFLINIIILIGVNLLIKPLYLFGVEAEVQNLVGISEWGIYFELFNFAYLFHILHEPGIQSFNSRSIAMNPESMPQQLSQILGIKLILFLLFLVVTISSFFVLGYDEVLLTLLVVICINQFLASFFMYLRTNIASVGKYRVDSFLSSIDKFLMLGIIGTMVYVPFTRSHFEIIWLAYGQFLAYLIACVIALFVIISHTGKLKIKFSWSYLIRIISSSYPYALILLFMTIYLRIDGVMLGRLLDDGGFEAGVYGACYRILEALNMIGYLFASLLLPMYASNLKNVDIINNLLKISLRSVITISFIAASGLMAFRQEFLNLLYIHATPYFGQVLMYLIGGFVMISVAYIFGTLLVAQGKLKQLNLLYVVGIIVNVVINLILIPLYKAEGAAIATLITQVLMTIGQIGLALKYSSVKIPYTFVLKTVFFGLLCGFIFFGIKYYVDMLWILNALIGTIIAGIIALSIGMIDAKSLLSLVESRKNQ